MTDDLTDDEMWDVLTRGSDEQWWDATGACGGCGSATCHEGRCPGSLCTVCPSRVAEGWFDRHMRTATETTQETNP